MNRQQYIVALAEQTQLSQDLATKIIDALYEKGLDAKDFDCVLWKLRSYMQNEELPKLINAADDDTISQLVDELIATRMQIVPMDACACSEASFIVPLNLGEKKDYAAGDTIDVQILRTGEWKHPVYGKFEVTQQTLKNMVKHFSEGVRGIDVMFDEDHDPQHKATSIVKKLYTKAKDTLWGTLELTAKGAQLLNEGAYRYISAEFTRNYKDIETGKSYSDLLLGGAFTNRPVVKGMAPILASEAGYSGATAGKRATSQHATLLLHSPEKPMLKFLDLVNSFVGRDTITASEREQFEELWAELSEDQRAIPEYKKAHKDVMALELSEESEAGDGEEEEDGEGEGKDGEAGKEPVKASERKPAKKVVTKKKPAAKPEEIEADEPLELSEREELRQLREQKAGISQREQAIRLSEAETHIDEMFEAAPGVELAPKSKKALATFAVSLSEKQEEQLWNILDDMKFVMLGELGYGRDEEGAVVLSESHPSIQKLMKAGYTLSESQEIAAEAMGKPLPKKEKTTK